MAKNLLVTERQREELLNKVKKTQSKSQLSNNYQSSPTLGGFNSSDLSDTDKMELQLNFDFKKFSEILVTFTGLSINNFEVFSSKRRVTEELRVR
jgi:hypothetical protein